MLANADFGIAVTTLLRGFIIGGNTQPPVVTFGTSIGQHQIHGLTFGNEFFDLFRRISIIENPAGTHIRQGAFFSVRRCELYMTFKVGIFIGERFSIKADGFVIHGIGIGIAVFLRRYPVGNGIEREVFGYFAELQTDADIIQRTVLFL